MNVNGTKIKTRKIKKDVVDVDSISNDNVDVAFMMDEKSLKVNSSKNKRTRSKKIRMSMSKAEEQRLEQGTKRDDNMSIGLMVLILALCFAVGITLGYLLYRIAINGVI